MILFQVKLLILLEREQLLILSGNTSAFLKSDDGKNMMLIDCGEKVFSDLKKYRLLDGVENIHLYLTHLHPDHAGSLGTLIYYMYYMVKPMFQPKVFLHLPVDNSDKVIKYLNLSGVIYDTHYVFVPEPESAAQMFPNQRTSIGNIDRVLFVPQKHDKTLQCYGLLLYLSDDSMIYYSADASDISSVIINRIVTGKIREAYIDVSTFDYEDNIHLSHLKLKKIIDESLSEHTDKIFCMHLDDNWTPELTKSLGNGVREVKCIWER